MRVQRLDERLAAIVAPVLDPLDSRALGPNDVLVLCAGFEDRAAESLRRAVTAGSKGFHVISVEYLPANDANRGAEVLELSQRAGATCERFTYDREAPAGAGGAVLQEGAFRRVSAHRCVGDVPPADRSARCASDSPSRSRKS